MSESGAPLKIREEALALIRRDAAKRNLDYAVELGLDLGEVGAVGGLALEQASMRRRAATSEPSTS
jgi:hypothetical protein